MNDNELIARLEATGRFLAEDGNYSVLVPRTDDAHAAAARIRELSRELDLTQKALSIKDNHDKFDCTAQRTKLEIQNRRLEADNERLRARNERLKAKLTRRTGGTVNDNELADRTHRTAEAWEKIADGRANDERLIVSGYQAHDTAQTLRLAAARIRELNAEVDVLRRLGLHHDVAALEDRFKKLVEVEAENERLRAELKATQWALKAAGLFDANPQPTLGEDR